MQVEAIGDMADEIQEASNKLKSMAYALDRLRKQVLEIGERQYNVRFVTDARAPKGWRIEEGKNAD